MSVVAALYTGCMRRQDATCLVACPSPHALMCTAWWLIQVRLASHSQWAEHVRHGLVLPSSSVWCMISSSILEPAVHGCHPCCQVRNDDLHGHDMAQAPLGGADDEEGACLAAQRLEHVYNTFAAPSGKDSSGGSMNLYELGFALKSITGEQRLWCLIGAAPAVHAADAMLSHCPLGRPAVPATCTACPERWTGNCFS